MMAIFERSTQIYLGLATFKWERAEEWEGQWNNEGIDKK
jgi:hypothetical protein